MAVPKKLINYLAKTKVKFEVIRHKTVYTAYDLALTTRKKLQEIAKTVLVKADKDYYLIVIPSHFKLDLGKLKKVLAAKKVRIAKEGEMKSKFKVKLGGITPFGSIHKVRVVLDKALLKVKEVLLGSGSFTESIKMSPKDFLKLESDNVQQAVVGKRDVSKKEPKINHQKLRKKKTKRVKAKSPKRRSKKTKRQKCRRK